MFENKSLAKEEFLLRNERKCDLGGSLSVRKSLASRHKIQVQIPWKPAEEQHPEHDSTFGKFTMQ